jgi:hypothetical protein
LKLKDPAVPLFIPLIKERHDGRLTNVPGRRAT